MGVYLSSSREPSYLASQFDLILRFNTPSVDASISARLLLFVSI